MKRRPLHKRVVSGLSDERRCVEEIDAETKRFTNGGDGFFFRDRTEDVAERRGTEADATEFKACVSKLPKLELRISRH